MQNPRANTKRFTCNLHLSAECGLVFSHDSRKSDHAVTTSYRDFNRVAVFRDTKQRDNSSGDKPGVINLGADIKKDTVCFSNAFKMAGIEPSSTFKESASKPAILKALLKQTFRTGFATPKLDPGKPRQKLLAGKTARIVVTMGMPAFLYRWHFRAHSLKSLEQNILGFCGIGPIRKSLIGMVEAGEARRKKWLKKMRALGREDR